MAYSLYLKLTYKLKLGTAALFSPSIYLLNTKFFIKEKTKKSYKSIDNIINKNSVRTLRRDLRLMLNLMFLIENRFNIKTFNTWGFIDSINRTIVKNPIMTRMYGSTYESRLKNGLINDKEPI